MEDLELKVHIENVGATLLERLPNHRSRIRFSKTGYTGVFYDINISRGEIKDRLEPNFLGIGYVGYREKKRSKYCQTWSNMMHRCYSWDRVEKYVTYKGCEVHSKWHSLSEFCKWCEETHPENDERYEIDKDIKVKGNKIYSSETCLWIPKKLNQYICKGSNSNSTTGVMGVSPVFNNKGVVEGKYEVRCADGKGRRAYLGQVYSVEEGGEIYRAYKKERFVEMAEEYYTRSVIDSKTLELIKLYEV